MQTVPLNRPKWIASITCTAAAIFAVLAGICQQLSAKWSREWDVSLSVPESAIGLGIIAMLFLVVIVANVVMLLWSESDRVVAIGIAFSLLPTVALFFVSVLFARHVVRFLSPFQISP